MSKKNFSFLLIAVFISILSSCSKELNLNIFSKKNDPESSETTIKNPNEISRHKIYFNTDSYKISEQDSQNIVTKIKNDIEVNISKESKIKIVAEGNCDERGSERYNFKLGKRRAHAVKKLLVSSGVKPNRISVVSYGENKPTALGHDENSWSKNRRVDLIIMK